MKITTLKIRFAAMALCLCTVISSFAFCPVISHAASGDDLIAYVADENVNAYRDKYSEYLSGAGSQSTTWTGFAWKNDEVLSRVDILTRGNSYENVSLVTGDFVSENGAVIAKENISFTYLDAVKIKENNQLLFDIITDDTVRDMDKNDMYSAWVSIKVPEETEPGEYVAHLSVVAGGDVMADLKYVLTVYDLVQPELESVVDLWMWPYNSIRYYSGKTTEEYYGQSEMEDIDWNTLYKTRLDKKYFPALESELDLYAKAGGDTIFAQVNEENRTNGDPYPSLVKWTKNANGTMSFDYTDFDAWVELNMKHGIKKQIKCYAMGNFRNHIVYYDVKKGTVVNFTDSTGAKIWTQYWSMFLDDFIVHLEKKGWFDITYMALDERDYTITKAVIDEVKKHKNKSGKTLKIATAVASFDCEPLFDDIADLSLAYGMSGGHLVSIVEDRNKKGLITTLYTCGPQGSSMLNDAGKSAESIHVTYKEGTEGFLRWALQKYNADPFESSENYNASLCAGDCYLIYPSSDGSMKAQSAPRYEKLCEGLRDIEKMRYLEKNLTYIKNEVHNAMLETRYQADFREVIRTYSEVMINSEYPEFDFTADSYSIATAEKIRISLSDEAKTIAAQQTIETYIDDASFNYSDGWTSEGQYFWLFLYSTNHYRMCSSPDAQQNTSYEFDFYGDSFIIKGSKGGEYGICDVYIDGAKAGEMDMYAPGSTAFYSELYSSEKLTLDNHHVKVVGAGKKNAKASSYRMQVDYVISRTSAPIEWTSSNTDVATVSESGLVTGVHAGKAVISAKCGEFTARSIVTVRADKKALGEKIDEMSALNTDGFSDELRSAFQSALDSGRAVYADQASSETQISDAYDTLVSAYEALVDKISLTSRPNKTMYSVGDDFDVTGAVITVKFKDGSEKELTVTQDMITGYDLKDAGVKNITVSYAEKTVTIWVVSVSDIDLTQRFTDVKSGAWYYQAVQYAITNSVFSGMSDTTFEPNTPMTRAMLVKVLYNIEGNPNATGYKNPFKDVKDGQWYTDAVKWAAANGVVFGTTDTTFSPNDKITREQLSTILYRYSMLKGYDVSESKELSAFPDNKNVSGYALEAMSWAVAAGLISGNEVNGRTVLDPRGAATRAQVALILMRYAMIAK